MGFLSNGRLNDVKHWCGSPSLLWLDGWRNGDLRRRELLKTLSYRRRPVSEFYKYLILLAHLDPGPAQPLWLFVRETFLRFLEVPWDVRLTVFSGYERSAHAASFC